MWAIALSLKLFGLQAFSVRLPSILLSAFAVLLCYDLGRRLFSPHTGMLAAFFYAFSGIALDLVAARMATDHPDVFLSFFVLAGVYAGFRASTDTSKGMWWLLLMGLSAGAALLSKWLPALIVFPLVFACYRRSGHSRLRSALALIVPALVAALIFLPWQVYIRQHFPLEAAIESRYNYLHFFEVLEGPGEPWYYFLNRMRIDYRELIYIPVLAALITVVRKKGSAEGLLLVWAGIPLLVFSAAATKMRAYLFVAAPAFFLLTAVFVDRLFAGEYLQGNPIWRKLRIAAFLLIPVRYCIERGKFFRSEERNPQWVRDIRN